MFKTKYLFLNTMFFFVNENTKLRTFRGLCIKNGPNKTIKLEKSSANHSKMFTLEMTSSSYAHKAHIIRPSIVIFIHIHNIINHIKTIQLSYTNNGQNIILVHTFL
uniref:Uncharacterized protein n=1 Tax=Cacopsylla melanoneura TaxID=428564 RepID=A0A8D9EW47_9HEMI